MEYLPSWVVTLSTVLFTDKIAVHRLANTRTLTLLTEQTAKLQEDLRCAAAQRGTIRRQELCRNTSVI